MRHSHKIPHRTLLLFTILTIGLFDLLGLTGVIDARAFSNAFSATWSASSFDDWSKFKIGACSGQNHSVSGGALHMSASSGTDCFGAYYNDYDWAWPGDKDLRIMWRWRYPSRDDYGTQAGQVAARYGDPQYYGVSAVDTPGSGGTDNWHILTDGNWGTHTVDNPLRAGTDHDWHVSTFDWLCDGARMTWWLDGTNLKWVNESGYALPVNDDRRPHLFWQGNLMDSVPNSGGWTAFDIDYLYVYAVERPQLDPITPGGGGTQTVSWGAVPNTTQPDGTTWPLQYQVLACNSSTCTDATPANILAASPWIDSTSYTFTGLPLNQTIYYKARAKWAGTPELKTCWGNTLQAAMTGSAELAVSQTGPTAVQYGDVINYSLTVRNNGNIAASNVVVVDTLPAGVRAPGSAPSPGSPMAVTVNNGGSYANGQIQWTVGNLSPGQSATVSWQTGLKEVSADTLDNEVRATASGLSSPVSRLTTQVLQPRLTLTAVAPDFSYPGGPITYNFTLKNIGAGRTLKTIMYSINRVALNHWQPADNFLTDWRDITGGGFHLDDLKADYADQPGACAYIYPGYPGEHSGTVWEFDRVEAGEKKEGAVTVTFSPPHWSPEQDTAAWLFVLISECTWNRVNTSTGTGAYTHLIRPQLELVKNAPAEIWPGGAFSYNITAYNRGTVPIVGLVTTDPLPNYVINPTHMSGGSLVGNTVTWNSSAPLEPGQAAAYSWDFEVDPDIPAVDNITNVAYAASSGLSAQASDVSALSFAVMELTKSASPTVYPGGAVNYTIRVANTSTPLMTGIVITDTIPRYVTGISGISHGGQIVDGQIVWRPAPVYGGSYVDLTWHGQIDANIPRYETQIINRVAGIAAGAGDSAEATSSLTYPEMQLTKSGPAHASPGQVVEYRIVVKNSGNAPLLDVLVRDVAPDYLLNIDVPAGALTAGVITWDFARLEPGEQQELIWRATIAGDIPDEITTIINRVTGTATGGIEKRAETATSLLFPSLNLIKQASPEVWPGGAVNYTIRVENNGVVELKDIAITDLIPDYVLNPVEISHGGVVNGTEIVWELGDLAPGAFHDLSWDGTIDPAIPQNRTVIRNQVQGRAAGGVSSVSGATSLVLFPGLAINKSGTVQAGPGDPVQYVIEVQNASAAAVEGVVVVDKIPEYIVNPANISAGGRVEGTEIIWELGRLNGAQSHTLLWEGVIDNSVPLGRSYLDNQVTVCDESGRYCDEAVYRMRLLQADARVTKAATPYGHPGSEVDYVIRVQNTGETTLEQVVIHDPLPDYIEYPHDISGGGEALPSPFEGEAIAVVWRLDQLAMGEIVELRWRGRIAVDTPPSINAIENKVTVTDRRGLQREASGATYVMHPQLRLLKEATPQAGPGETVAYSLVLENPGLVPAYEVELTDLIPPYILTPTRISAGGLRQADDITWRFAELAAGQGVTLTWQGTVDPKIPATETQIVNLARAANPAGALAEDAAATDLTGQALALRKTATAVVEPGGEIGYTLIVENKGPAALTGLTLTDPIPTYVEHPAQISAGGSADSGLDVVWNIARIEAGQTLSFSWQGIVARDMPVEETEIVNEARLTSAGGLALTAQARSLARHPLLALDKTATLKAGPGDQVAYTLTVRNLGGGAAYDVSVTDPIPAYVEAETAAPGATLAADQVRWALIGSLLPGHSQSLTWTGRIDPLTPFDQTGIVNTATAAAAGGQTATAQAVTDLERQQVSLRQQATAVVSPGSDVAYVITVENSGATALYDLVITDPIPAEVRNARLISSGGLLEGNAQIRWEIPLLAPGQVISVSWTGTVVENLGSNVAILWNEASLAGGSGLTAIARAKSLVRRPRLTLDKQATPLAGPGELIYYFLAIHNRGEAPAYEVTVTDLLPPEVEVSSVYDGGQEQGDAVVWQLAEVGPDETVTVDWYGRVRPDIPAAKTEIINQATVETPDGSRAEAAALTRLKPQQLRLVKQATAQVYAGGVVTYALTVENRGEATLYGLSVSDPLPADVQEARIVSAGSGAAARVEGNQAVTWDVPALAVGKALTMTWRGVVARDIPASQTEILNQATAETAGGLETQATASSRLAQPVLTLDKKATLEAGPGGKIDYTLTLRNSGQAPAYDVEVLDPIPAYLERATAPTPGEVRAEAVRWQVASLAAGQSQTLTWSGYVATNVPADLSEIVNTATVSDGAGREVEASAVTHLIRPDAPLVAKAATYEVYPGGAIIYTITVKNPGAASLYDVTVTDPIPDYVLSPTGLSSGGLIENNTTVVWRLAQLAAGQSQTLSWRGAVARDIPASKTEIFNQVTVETASGLRSVVQARSFVRQPVLTLDKEATLAAGPGGQIDYTLTLRNSGQALAYDVEVLDPIPAYLERATAPTPGEVRAEAVRWQVASLAAGQSQTLTWSGYVAHDVPADLSEIVNTATVSDGAGRQVEASAVTHLVRPDAPLVAKAATYEVYPGGVVTYSITVRNPGAAILYDVTVTDPIPDHVLSPTGLSSGGLVENNTIVVWRLAQLAAGQSQTLSWRGTVARDIPASKTEIFNQVTVETASGLRRVVQARSFVRQPVLTLDKSATLEVGPGGQIDYSLTLRNSGQAPAYDLVLLDPIPDYLERATAPAPGEVRADAVRWQLATLTAGQSQTLTWSGYVATDAPADLTEIVNTATVSDGAGREVEASAVTHLIRPDAPLVAQAATYEVYPGGPIVYTITVKNPGTAILYDVIVTDPIPDYVLSPTGLSSGGLVENNTTVVWRLAQLAAGQSQTLSWRGVVARDIPASKTEILNQVTVETASGLRSAVQARSFIRQPVLTLDKSATLEVGPGDQIDYSLTLRNSGQAPAYDLVLLDPIPDYLEQITTPAPGEVRAEAVRWQLPTLAAGQSQTLTWSATVATDAPADLSEIVNTATVSDGAGREIEASAVTHLLRPKAPLVAQAGTYEVWPGGVITYAITLKNLGAATLYDLTIRDPIPAYVLNPTGLSSGGRLEGNTVAAWDLPAMAPGDTVELVWQGTVARDIPAKESQIASTVRVETGNGQRAEVRAVSFVRQPQPVIAKAATLQAGPGDMVEYVIQIGNLSRAPAYDVIVTDPIPAGIIGASSATGELRADEIVWRFETLAPGAVETLTWSGFVDPDLPAAINQIVNTAAVADAAGHRDEATAVTDLPGQAVSLRKDATYEVFPGGGISYTLTVINRSDSRLYDVVVRDPLPARVLNPTAISGQGYLDGNLAVVWEMNSLAPGAVETLTWQGLVDPATPAKETIVTNEASLTTRSGLAASARAKSWLRQPQLALTKTAPAQAAAGEIVPYALTVANLGAAPAYNVEVRDPLPDYLLNPTSSDGAVLGDAVVWLFDRLEPGETRSLAWQGTVAQDTPAAVVEIVNTAAARDAGGQEVQAGAVTRLVQPDLWLAMAGPLQAYPGGAAVYTLTVTNPGQAPLYDLMVTNPLPAAMAPPLSVADGGELRGASLVWQLPLLAPTESRLLRWSAGVNPALPAKEVYLWNQATAAAANGLTATAEVRTWLNRPALRLDKSATLESGAGGTIAYTLTVRNEGQAPAYGLEVLDPIPAYIINPIVDDEAVIRAEAVTWRFDELPAGQSRTLTWQGTVQADIPPGASQIVNQATAADAAGSTAIAQATTRLTAQRLELTQDATYQSYPGGAVVYTLTVTNRGATSLADIAVRNPIPTGVTEPTGLSAGGRLEGNLAVVWDIASLAAGQSQTMVWRGTVNRSLSTKVTSIQNAATAATASGLTATAEARTWLSRAGLRLDKSATPASGAGGTIVYTLTVRNSDQAPAYDLEVLDPIPDYLEQITSPEGDVQAEAITWSFDELSAGESRTLTWSGSVADDAPPSLVEIVNRAEVTDAAGDKVTAQATTRLASQKLALAQEATYQSYPGGGVVYTMTVTNRGAASLADIAVRNPIPTGVSDPTGVSAGGRLDGNLAVIWEIAGLAAGQSRTLTWQGTVDRSLSAKVSDVRSTATASTAGGLTATAEARTWLNRPSLRLDKSATPASGAGGVIAYSLTVHNAGQAPAYDLTLTDPIPAYIVSPTGVISGEVQARAITWSFDELPAGESRTLTWQGTVQPDVPPSLVEIVNRAEVTDAAGSSVSALATTRLASQKLELTQEATYQSHPGGSVVYTMTVTNRGAAGLADIAVRNPIPTGISDPTGLSAGGRLDGNLAVVWEIASLAAGQSRTLTWQGAVNRSLSTKVTSLQNAVTAASASGLTAKAEARTLLQQPLLFVEKTATSQVGPGEPVTYTILIRNIGLAPAYDLTVTDPIPVYITNPTGVISGEIRAEAIVWRLDKLPAGQSRTLTWQGVVVEDVPASQTQVANTVRVARSDEQLSAQALTWLRPQRATLAVAGPYQLYPGQRITYTLTVKNDGAADLYHMAVTNPLPEYVTDPTAISANGRLDGNERIVWDIPRLAAGNMVTLTWQGAVATRLPAAVVEIKNEAALMTGGGLVVSGQTKSLVAQPRLLLDQTAPFEAGPGEVISYVLTLRNAGAAPAYDLVVENPLPEHLLDPDGVSAPGRIEGNLAVIWEFERLAAGESRTLTWRATVDPQLGDTVRQIVNTAMIEDKSGHSDEAQVVTSLVRRRVDFMQTATYQSYPGGSVVYTLTVRNPGSAALYDVTVTNPIPAYVLDPTGVSGGGQVVGNATVVWKLPLLAAGEEQQLSWHGTLARTAPRDVAELWNEASLATGSGLTAEASARTLIQQPALLLDKSATVEAGPGEPVQYRLIVRNVGQAPAYDLTVTDPVPAYVVNPTGVISGEIRAEAVVWRLAGLAAGQSQTLTWQGAVAGGVPETTSQIASTATVRDGAGSQAEADAVTWLRRQSVTLLLAASPEVYPGGSISYTLTVQNHSRVALYDLTVSNPIPAYVRDPTAISGGGRADGNETVFWKLASLGPGETRTLTWQGAIARNVPDSLVEIKTEASLTTGSGLSATAQARSRVDQPALRLDLLAATQAGPGETLGYTLTLRNVGQAPAYEVELRQPLPAHLLTPTGSGVIQADAISWSFDPLPAGETYTLTWQGRLDPQLPATVAEIASAATVTDAAGRSLSSDAVTAVDAQRFYLTQAGPDLAGPGQTAVYTLTLHNSGQAVLSDLIVTNPLPDDILQPRVTSGGGQVAGNTGLRWQIDRLTPGQTITLTWQGQIDPDLPAGRVELWNTAQAVNSGGLTAEAQARTRLLRPSLRLANLAPPTVSPGGLISYTFIVENVGPVTASNLELLDPVPAYVRSPGLISGGGFVDYLPAYGVRWKLGDLLPGSRRVVSWQGQVDPRIPLAADQTTILTNTVTARAGGGVSAVALGQSVVLAPHFELGARATAQAGPGETVIYALILTNTGQAPVSDLIVTSAVPDHLTPLDLNGGSLAGDWLTGPTLRWQPAPLAVGDTRIITWSGRIALDVPAEAAWLDSQVTAVAPSGLMRRAEAAVRLLRPQFHLIHEGLPALIDPGDTITYTLTISNSDRTPLFETTLTEHVPAHLIPQSTAGARLETDRLVWRLGDLPPGAVRRVTWGGQLAPNAPLSLTDLRSRAVLTAAGGVQTEAWVTTAVRQPRLALTVTGPAQVQPGEIVRYTLTVSNTGLAPALHVRLTDILPLSGTVIDAGTGVVSGGQVIWPVGHLAPNEQRAVTVQVRLAPDIPADRIINQAVAAAGELVAEAETTAVLREPALLLTNRAVGLPSPGARLTYTLRLRNTGAGLARDVVLTNPLPDYLEVISAQPAAEQADRTLTWQPDRLATGDSFEAVWSGRVAFDLPETTTAVTSTATAVSPDAARPVTAAAVLPVAPPALSAQAICPMLGQAGQVLSYSLRLHNTGGTLLTPTLLLTLPPGAAYVPASASLDGQLETGRTDVWGAPLPDRLRWTLPPMYAGDRLQPSVALTATAALTDILPLKAELLSQAGRSLVRANCATTLSQPRLALAHHGPARALVGDVVTWQLVVTSTGLVNAYDTVLTDTLPPGLSYVDGSAPDVTVLTETHASGWPITRLVWRVGDLAPGQRLERNFRTRVSLPLEYAAYPLAFNAQNEATLESQAKGKAQAGRLATAVHQVLVPRPALELARQAVVEADQAVITYQVQPEGETGPGGPAVQPLFLTVLTDTSASPPLAVAGVQAWPGSRIRHILRGGNLGPGQARQVTLVERVPANLLVLTGTISAGGVYDPATHTISWPLGDLAAGQRLEHSYTVLVPLSLRPDLAILENNRAELRAIDASTVYASAATTLDADLRLAMTKSAPAVAAPGAELAYVIRVQNVNRSPLDQVTITDPLPDFTTYLTGSASLPPELLAAGRTLRWNLGMLSAGEGRQVSFKLRVDEDPPAWVLQVRNRAEATWTGGQIVTAEAASRLPGAALAPTPTPPPAGGGAGGGSGSGGHSGGGSAGGGAGAPPPVQTPILRTTAVVAPLLIAPTPTLTPTVAPMMGAAATATPRPQPLLRQSVSTDTVPAGQLTLLTWQFTFSNPTPLTIGDLVIRDLLPPGLLYLQAETSQGVVEVSPRSIYSQRPVMVAPSPALSAAEGPALTPSPRPTRRDYLTAEQAGLVLRPTVLPAAVPSPTARLYTTLPALTMTSTVTGVLTAPAPAATPTAIWPGLNADDLPGVDDVPPTEVLFRLGDLTPGGRVRMTIKTLVLADARAGTRYDNVGSFAAANMDPGVSNQRSVRVVSATPLFILPVTGGLLALVDPRTPQGRVSWVLFMVVAAGVIGYRRWKKTTSNKQVTEEPYDL